MKTKITALILALLLLAGCAAPAAEQETTPSFVSAESAPAAQTSAQPATEAASRPCTFTDDLGRTVTVENPRRVAALLGSFAQVWYLSGGTVIASADDAWDDFQLPMPEDAVNLGMTKDLSLEKLFAAEPDFIIASANTSQHVKWRETLEATGIPLAYFDVTDFEDYLRMLKICTDITGREDLYQENGVLVQSEIDDAIAHSVERLNGQEGPTVLSIRASASMIRAKNSKDNVLGEMLKALGCVNIADSDDTLLENLSMEHILQADPTYIFFVPSGDDLEGMEENLQRFFAENPAWQQLSAVKEGRVYYLDKALYNLKPNDRWGEAYAYVEKILSGEV